MLLAACHERSQSQAQPDRASTRPTLALLTGLPLAFGEGFTLNAPRHPAMARLEAAFRVELIDGPEQLGSVRLLLAAQPRALTAERLVALDGWVRGGGRLLLLADPQLSWPTDLPLGDKQRPPFQYADTGLLARWGLRLEAPPPGSGETRFAVGGHQVASPSAGSLERQRGSCRVAPDRRTARCDLGRGSATIVADADFITGDGGPEALVAAVSALAR